MSCKEDLQAQIKVWGRRLNELKKQQALFGVNTPPEINIEIKDIEKRLEELQAELTPLEGVEVLKTSSLPLTNIPYSYVDLFVGRERELGDVLGPWMRKETKVRAIIMTGIGGIGKTSLAVAAALRYRQEFPGGMVFVTARDNPGFGLETLFLEMDRTLGTQLRYQDSEVRPALARARLNELRHLLILDNLETAPLESIASIVDFLCTLEVRETGTLTLMTGRDMPKPFFDLAPRHHLSLDSLEQNDAIALLQRLAADALVTSNELDGHWAEATAQCYGHPLLIRLLVGLVQYEDWQTVRRRMQDLSGGIGQQVDALLQESIARLSQQHPRARQVLWGLGAFAGGAALEALNCVQEGISIMPRDSAVEWNEDNQQQFLNEIEATIRHVAESQEILDQVSEALGILCRGRLVERSGNRYDLHPLVRSYVRERGWSESASAAQVIQQSHAAYFLWYVGNHQEDYRALEQELSNIRAGFACACADPTGDERMVFFYTGGMDAFLDMYGYWEEDLQWLAKWAEACQVLDDVAILNAVYNNMGLIHSYMGNYSVAMEYYQKALKGKEQSGAGESSLADTYGNIGSIHFYLGDFEQALAWIRRSLEIDERLGDEQRLCTSYNNIGGIYYARGEYEEAVGWLQKGLALAEKLGDQAKMALSYNNIGSIYQARGEYEEALGWLQKGLALAEKLGDQATMALGYNNIGEIYRARGEYEEALNWFQKGLALAEKLGYQAKMASGYNNIGMIYQARGEYEEAVGWLQKGLALAEKLGDQATMVAGYNNIGMIYEARGDYAGALGWLQKGLALAEQLGDQAKMALGYNNIGLIYHARGEYEEAVGWFQKGLALAEQLGDQATMAVGYNNIGEIYRARGDYAGALSWLQKGLALAEKLGDQAKMALGYNNIGSIYHARGEYEEALGWLQKGLALAEKLGDQATINRIKANLTRLLFTLDGEEQP